MSNDAYGWTQGVAVNRAYATNGLNQYTASGAIAPTYDGRGNMTSAGAVSYVYDSRNRLTGFGTNTLGYDAMGRVVTQGTPATRFVYDGNDLIAETDGSNNILRRYVHGPGTDEVVVWYEGSGTTDKRWLARDERGSTTLITGGTGAVLATNAYDDYGIPQSTNLGRFQYTGQTWIPELGMYYYKARIYSATMGRFMQTDPSGYGDGLNWYNYTKGDPINGTDPSGLEANTPYNNYESAVIDALLDARALSNITGNEWATSTYGDANGKFFYIDLLEGTPSESLTRCVSCLSSQHSHDTNGRFNWKDANHSQAVNRASYVVLKDGRVYRYLNGATNSYGDLVKKFSKSEIKRREAIMKQKLEQRSWLDKIRDAFGGGRVISESGIHGGLDVADLISVGSALVIPGNVVYYPPPRLHK